MSDEIIINLYQDYIDSIQDFFLKNGFTPDPNEEPLTTFIKFYNLELRSISQKPRKVIQAQNLSVPSQYTSVIDEIKRKAEAGELLDPHLSKRLLDLNYHDSLLNDWGLHHLHLSTNIGPSGFVDRTGPLLFARVTEDAFYLVAVLDHGNWTNKNLLEEILSNWPKLLEPFEIIGIKPATSISESEHATLRRKNVQTIVQLSNSKMYFPFGGGYTSSGANINAVLQHDKLHETLKRVEDDIRQTYKTREKELQPGKSFGSPPTFRLLIHNDDLIVVENHAKIGYRYSI